MIIKSKKTGIESCITAEEWQKIKDLKIQGQYIVVDNSDFTPEVKNIIPATITEFITKKNNAGIVEDNNLKTKYERKRTIDGSVVKDFK